MKAQRTINGIYSTESHVRWNEINSKVLAGNVSYGHTIQNTDEDRNLNIWKATGTSPGIANTDFTVNHQLGHIPITIVGQDTNNGGVLYRGSVAWTATSVTLRCTAASSVYNLILG
jgi:hypothetical protein